MNQMNPVHTFPTYFPKTHFNIIFPSTLTSYKWSLPFRFSNKNFVSISHLPCVLHALLVIFGEAHKLWSSSLCSLLSPLVSCLFLPLQYKYSLQHPLLKHPQCIFLASCYRQSFTPIQNNRYYTTSNRNLLTCEREQNKDEDRPIHKFSVRHGVIRKQTVAF